MPKIETKTRTYDEGLSIMKEVTKVITHDDGRVETKVSTFEIGKRTHHSDYWRDHYASDDDSIPNEISKKEYLKRKCLHDVARIANAFDGNINLGYKNLQNPANNPTQNVVLLNPSTAISEDTLGQKVDVFSGEILLGTALRKQNYKTKQSYVKHLNRAFDQKAEDVDRATSFLYLAMEADAACEHIKGEAPGFTEYAHARARKYVSETGSGLLQDDFATGKAGPGHKFAALIREFDTFGSQPLDYGDFNKPLKDVMEQVRKLPDSKSRLAAAEQLAYRYLVQQQGQVEMPEQAGAESQGAGDGKKIPGEGQGKPQPGNNQGGDPQNNDGEGQENIDLEMMEEMLSSADMLGKPADPSDLDSDNNAGGVGWEKPKKPSEIMKSQMFDGHVPKPPVILTKKVESVNNPQAIYTADKKDVHEVSEAIEESLEILNHEEQTWEEYSLRRGEIDEGALHKLIDNSDNVFYRVETMPKMRIQVGLLIDESGSMACYAGHDSDGNIQIDRAMSELYGENWALTRSGVARKLATAFLEGTKNISGVDLQIYGHAGPHPKCRVYEYTNAFTPESEFHRVAHITERLHNYDGYAILKSGENMLEYDEDYTRRIMFIISDGEPSVANYNGPEAKKHIASVVRWLNESGVETYAIGVDNAFPPKDGADMYGNDKFVILPNFNLSEVAVIISSFLEEICRG